MAASFAVFSATGLASQYERKARPVRGEAHLDSDNVAIWSGGDIHRSRAVGHIPARASVILESDGLTFQEAQAAVRNTVIIHKRRNPIAFGPSRGGAEGCCIARKRGRLRRFLERRESEDRDGARNRYAPYSRPGTNTSIPPVPLAPRPES